MTDTLEVFSALPTEDRADFYRQMSRTERRHLASTIDRNMGSQYGEYRYDPVGFVNEVLGEPTWSKQREILESVLRYKVTAVPAGHSVSKSHTAARVVAWWTAVHPPGTALTITTATNFQQVKTILWPHIRKMVARHNLPGSTNTTDWSVMTEEGMQLAAYGFSASDNDEAAVQGRHAPHFLIVVDEAGGISHELGKAFMSLMTGGHTRMLLIGNPSTEEENTWFQKRCESGRKNTNVVPIPIYATPQFTGEDPGICRSCPKGIPEHSVATHLVDKDWEREVIEEFGADSAYVEARAFARFPSQIADKVLPIRWLEAAKDGSDNSVTHGRIALGCDIAADGGDEFTIAWRDGFSVKMVHTSVGAQNENSEVVADKIQEFIHKASLEHKARGITQRVRVKIDTIGVGWGVVGSLIRRGEEGKHDGIIVPVSVGKTAGDSEKFVSQRAEMWWNFRTLIQPVPVAVPQISDVPVPMQFQYEGVVKLDLSVQELAQLSGPMYRPDSSGRIAIEKKSEMKRRGVKSPDRAEAILLAFYEPPTDEEKPVEPFMITAIPRATESWRGAAGG